MTFNQIWTHIKYFFFPLSFISFKWESTYLIFFVATQHTNAWSITTMSPKQPYIFISYSHLVTSLSTSMLSLAYFQSYHNLVCIHIKVIYYVLNRLFANPNAIINLNFSLWLVNPWHVLVIIIIIMYNNLVKKIQGTSSIAIHLRPSSLPCWLFKICSHNPSSIFFSLYVALWLHSTLLTLSSFTLLHVFDPLSILLAVALPSR